MGQVKSIRKSPLLQPLPTSPRNNLAFCSDPGKQVSTEGGRFARGAALVPSRTEQTSPAPLKPERNPPAVRDQCFSTSFARCRQQTLAGRGHTIAWGVGRGREGTSEAGVGSERHRQGGEPGSAPWTVTLLLPLPHQPWRSPGRPGSPPAPARAGTPTGSCPPVLPRPTQHSL